MEIEEVIKICRERNEIDFLFQITKQIAESDSIGEGWGYCENYTEGEFNNAEKHITSEESKERGFKDFYSCYLEQGGIPVYLIYLRHIGAIK